MHMCACICLCVHGYRKEVNVVYIALQLISTHIFTNEQITVKPTVVLLISIQHIIGLHFQQQNILFEIIVFQNEWSPIIPHLVPFGLTDIEFDKSDKSYLTSNMVIIGTVSERTPI